MYTKPLRPLLSRNLTAQVDSVCLCLHMHVTKMKSTALTGTPGSEGVEAHTFYQ